MKRLLLTTFIVATLVACDDNGSATTTDSPTASDSQEPSADSSNTDATGTGADDATPATPAPSVAAPSITTAATQPDAVIDIVNQPGSGDFEGALDDAELLECAAAAGQWTAAGTLTNSTNDTVDYRVYVSFLDDAGETLGLVETDVDGVEPEQSVDWSAGFASAAVDLRCVLRVERRSS